MLLKLKKNQKKYVYTIRIWRYKTSEFRNAVSQSEIIGV